MLPHGCEGGRRRVCVCGGVWGRRRRACIGGNLARQTLFSIVSQHRLFSIVSRGLALFIASVCKQ